MTHDPIKKSPAALSPTPKSASANALPHDEPQEIWARLSSEERRCLTILAGDGAFGRAALREGYLALAKTKKTITLAVSLVRMKTSETLVEKGLAVWFPAGESARLLITKEGRAAFAASTMALEHTQGRARDRAALELVSIEAPEGRRDVLVDRRESPLAWLARRKGSNGKALLEPAAYAAGERLRADFERAGLSPRVSVDWSRFGMGSSASSGREAHASDAMIAARARMRKAIETMGADLAGPVIDICCFLKGLDVVERERGWPPRSAKLILTFGLERLAQHYGLSNEARGKNSSKSIAVWTA